MYIEIFIVAAIIAFIYFYRKNTGDNSYKFLADQVAGTYEKYAPYSFKVVRKKAQELGQEYTTRQYVIQIALFGIGAAFVSYLYFYSIIWSVIYASVAILIIPYLTFMRCKKAYSEFIFEQIQVYSTNVIMEFNTTQSFVKALEGVRDSGVLEEPLLGDVKDYEDYKQKIEKQRKLRRKTINSVKQYFSNDEVKFLETKIVKEDDENVIHVHELYPEKWTMEI